MTERRKAPLVFYRTAAGGEPVREWLNGLWEVRTDLPSARIARVLFCVHKAQMVALHGFIKKTQAIPNEDLKLARKRKKEIER